MYPILINLEDKPVLVVGGGRVACRKIKTLLSHGAEVTVVSPTLYEGIPRQEIVWLEREFQEEDLNGFLLVFACTDNAEVNHQVKSLAPMSQLVNNTGDKHDSDFYNMKLIELDEVMISVSTKGRSAKLSKAIGNEVKKWAQVQVPEIVKGLEDDE